MFIELHSTDFAMFHSHVGRILRFNGLYATESDSRWNKQFLGHTNDIIGEIYKGVSICVKF